MKIKNCLIAIFIKELLIESDKLKHNLIAISLRNFQ